MFVVAFLFHIQRRFAMGSIYWLVAEGFDFLDAAPYSPMSDFGNNSGANHQRSIFISSCFCDVETIFSTAEKHEDGEQDTLFFIEELSSNERGRSGQSSANLVRLCVFFHVAQHDIRLKWRIWSRSERKGWVASAEHPRMLCISWRGPVFSLLRGALC